MREREGAKTKKVLSEGMASLKEMLDGIKSKAPDQPKKIQERIKEKLEKWQLTAPIDAQRLEWEVAFYADRADITEELDRIDMLISEFQSLVEKKGAIGRKLDFVVQELNREWNTLGSKTELNEITQCVVEAKSQIEKLRQQVQNVE